MPGAFAEIWGDWYYDKDMNVVVQPGAFLNWRMPTAGETRWQVWEGLASGAKGVIYFVLFPPGNDRGASSAPGSLAIGSNRTCVAPASGRKSVRRREAEERA